MLICRFKYQKRSKLKGIFLLLCFFSVLMVRADYNITSLTNNDGLSNSSVNSIFQDSTGLMWFGTWDGLNVYNSREFKVYKPDVNNPSAISNNIIRNVVEENSQTLWIATDRGIDRLDRTNNVFEHYFVNFNKQSSPVENAFLLAKNNQQTIFVQIYEQGLFYFDNEKQQFIKVNGTEHLKSKKMFFDVDDNLWIFTIEKQLYKATFRKNNLLALNSLLPFNQLEEIENVFFNPLRNEMWLQNSDFNLRSFSITSGYLSAPLQGQRQIPVNSMLFFDNYHMWGTSEGLFLYDLLTRKTETMLSGVQVLSLLKGTQQIIWVGTDMQGIKMLTPKNENFYAFTNDNTPGFGKNAIRGFIEKNNELWVATKGEGIFIFNKDSNNKISHQFKKNLTIRDGLLSNSIFALATDHDNELWIGTDGRGINYVDNHTQKIQQLHIPDDIKNDVKLSSIYVILPTENNVLWVGTSGYGIYKLEIDKSKFPYTITSYKQYVFNGRLPNSLSNNIVYSIIRDDEKHLWIGTRGGGLNRLNIDTEEFQVYRFSANHAHYISSDDILSLYKDKSNILWIGTSMGLNKLEYFRNNEPVFTRFTEHEGMPNNTVHGILEDEEHNIWVSTNRGIVKLIQNVNTNEYRIVSYFKKDGLQNNEFSDGAYYKSPSTSNMYFGGISGFNMFNPLSIQDNTYMPPLLLDAFYIQNEETNMANYIQTRKNKETLVLKDKFKSVSFKFVPLDYISGNKSEISYKLEGYDKEWIQLGTSTTLVLSNVPKGNYVLKIRNSNSEKIWNDNYFSLPVTVLPPWWGSIWAMLVYTILLLAIFLIVYQQAKYRLKARNDLREKELEKQKTEEIHQAKLRFFTNIAHEFSNSLTLIYAPSEQLLKIDSGEDTRKYVNSIRSNAQRMQSLIQQLIEFRKAETGFLKVKIETIDVQELIKYVVDNFIETLEQKKIKLELELPVETIFWNTDRDGFEKIIFNLISNAAKYTPEEQQLKIKVEIQHNNLSLIVTNTGVGIKKAHRNLIFDRFKVLEQFEMQISEGFETRSGIGLALTKNIVELLGGIITVDSDEETYTTFSVSLPQREIDEEVIKEQEKISRIKTSRVEVATTTPRISLTPDSSKKGLILIIDDEKEIRTLLSDILGNHYEIAEASDGNEAIEIMKVRMPFIIICDVIMPNMNGVEFIKIMKSQELTRHIPIILLSSKSSIESQIEGLETGADMYLAKPFHPRHLEALIENLTERNKAVIDYSKSHYARMEQFQGKLLHKEDKELLLLINRIIEQNIDDETLSLDYIASETAISKMQLYRKIKELTAQTPTEYIRAIRLQHAEHLLKTTHKTVQEIMYSCGFNNKAYFYREFSKRYNLTPKEYRNKAERK